MKHTRRIPGIALVALLALGSAGAVDVIEAPSLTMNPNFVTPLAGVIEFTTDTPVRARLAIAGAGETRIVNFPQAASEHALPVLGLKAETTYTISVSLVPGGNVATLFVTTPPLPDDFPAIETELSVPAAMEPGYTVLDCMRRANNDPRNNYTAIVDAAGDVVWYTTRCFSATRSPGDGTLYYAGGDGSSAVQSDLLGNTVTTPLDDPGIRLHHDLLLTPHGTWLSLTRTSIEVAAFPSSEDDPSAPMLPATLRDDSVVEFRADGSLRREWRLYDLMDPQRIGYDALNSGPDGLDWTHANAVHYRASDDSIIVSVRHQDAVIKFSRETGKLQWILGPHANWSGSFRRQLLTPVGTPFEWQYHQHAPMWTGDGNLLLFDNGNYRASPFDGTTPMAAADSYSRAVEYRIDEKRRTVGQVWSYGEALHELIYARFISDADWLPQTGNRLITFGGTGFVGGLSGADQGLGSVHARLIETTDDPVAVPVFKLIAYDPEGGRIAMYRSERIPGLYPPGYLQRPPGLP